jgi:hypothetical protein
LEFGNAADFCTTTFFSFSFFGIWMDAPHWSHMSSLLGKLG